MAADYALPEIPDNFLPPSKKNPSEFYKTKMYRKWVKCPITLEIMREPVMLIADGYTKFFFVV